MKALQELCARIRRYSAEVDAINRRSLVVFSDGALLVSGLIFVTSLFFSGYRLFVLLYGILFLYCGGLFFFARWFAQKKAAGIRAVFYLVLLPFMVLGILMGTSFDPQKPAITIYLFICILPLFLLDHPRRIILFQTAVAAAFSLCSYLLKPAGVFAADLLYLPIYLALGIGANLFTMMSRAESVENFALLRRESERDALTGLYNRRAGEENVRALLQAQVHGSFAILDIDDFKLINDRLGHQRGDEALCAVAAAITDIFRSSDVVWRMGGDEFAVYAVNLLDETTCRRRFAQLTQALAAALPQDGAARLGISVGCVLCAGERLNFDDIYRAGDAALYEAKAAGKGRIVVRS